MATHTTKIWIEARLFYTEPWEDFLIKILKPYCDTAANSGAIEKYFFIRYWEKGPHIRLRIFGEKNTIEHILKQNMKNYFENFFSMNPSRRDEPLYAPNTPNEHIWQDNNTILFVDYVPETERYAGQYGMQIAENQFFASSKAVLKNMELIGVKDWNADQALGIAIKLHLCFLHAVGFDLATAVQFLKEFLHHWLPLSIQRERIAQVQYAQQAEMLLHSYEQFFQQQKESLISYHAAIWDVLINTDKGASFEENYINDWYADCSFMRQEIMLSDAQNLLAMRTPKYNIAFEGNLSPSMKNVWELYADFVHLTNNRLGIVNQDESYLAFLMMRSLENFTIE
jgi:Lantibiotic biosynthesis dehydratase C-term